MTARSGALSRWGSVLKQCFMTVSGRTRAFARIDRLSGHLLKDVGLTNEKAALKHWQDFL